MQFFLKYFLLILILFFSYQYVSNSKIFTIPKRSVEFLNKATVFYKDPNNKISLSTNSPITNNNLIEKTIHNNKEFPTKRRSVISIVNNMKNHYKLSQEEMAARLDQLKMEKKELELSLAYEDIKLDSSFLLEPELRITIAAYLDISADELRERNWLDAELSTEIWTSLVIFSQSNDFRILLMNEKISRDEVIEYIKK